MTINKRRKVVKYRGSQTHGGGSKKKRRGAGHRGGRGLAGSGKRAHHNKQRIFKLFGKDYFGKKGFFSRKIKLHAVNISYIEKNLHELLKNKLASEKDNFIEIDLSKLKFDKLLSAGSPTRKYKLKVKYFSKKAKSKVESVGGQIVS